MPIEGHPVLAAIGPSILQAAMMPHDVKRPVFVEAPLFERMEPSKKQPKYSPEVIELAVRMVGEAASEYSSQCAAIESIAAKFGCTPETLRC